MDEVTLESVNLRIIDAVTIGVLGFYSEMEDYLQNIFNAPSTINRLLTYYSFAYNVEEPYERYLLFGGCIVKTFKMEWG